MLPKLHRLTRQEFITAKKLGKNYSFPHFSLVLHSEHIPKFSIVTSAKFHKNAVVRNRFRRQIYTIFSQVNLGIWLILYPKPSMLKLSRDQISSLLTSTLSSLPVS